MRKNLLLLFLFVFWSSIVFAQNIPDYNVSGIVCDSISGAGESYATVRLFLLGQTMPIATTLTDISGKFKIGTKQPGSYKLSITSIGKRSVERQVRWSTSQKAVKLGKLYIFQIDNALNMVTVQAQKPLVKAEVDKIIYSVEDDPEAQSNTAIEMLRKVPMVTVDGDDNIKINGNSSFKVYVNGKPNQMMSSNPSLVLKNYPAAVIKKIEVITHPGAKYDAEGVAGVLNIVTSDATKTSGYTLTPDLRFENVGVRMGLFGMTQIGKLTLSVHYVAGVSHPNDSKTSSEREVFSDADDHFFRSEGIQNHRREQFNFGELEGSYEFDKHNLLSISSGLFGYSSKYRSVQNYSMTSVTDVRQYGYDMFTQAKTSQIDLNSSLDYQHTFTKPEQVLTFSYRFGMTPQENKSTNTYQNIYNLPYVLTDLYADPDNHFFENTGQLDFTTPFGKHHSLSAGLKYIYRLNKSTNVEKSRTAGSEDDFQTDETRSLTYRHQGYISAAYAEYSFKTDSFKVVAGTRYEYYHIHVKQWGANATDFSSSIGDLVPSLSFGYNLTPTQMFRLGYNMRIARPDISMLSPYVNHTIYEAQSYGNPNLKSERTHNMELDYSNYGMKVSLNTTLAFMLSNNGLTDYAFIDSKGVTNTTWDNLLHVKVLSLSQFFSWNLTSTTRIKFNASAAYTDMQVSQMGDHNYGFAGSLWGGIEQTFPWKVKVNLYGGGNSSQVSLQGREKGFYFYKLSLNRSFLKDERLTVNIFAGNFLGRYHNFKNKTSTNTFRSESCVREDFLRLGIGFRYRFGSLNTEVKKTSHTIENSDIKKSSSDSQNAEN